LLSRPQITSSLRHNMRCCGISALQESTVSGIAESSSLQSRISSATWMQFDELGLNQNFICYGSVCNNSRNRIITTVLSWERQALFNAPKLSNQFESLKSITQRQRTVRRVRPLHGRPCWCCVLITLENGQFSPLVMVVNSCRRSVVLVKRVTGMRLIFMVAGRPVCVCEREKERDVYHDVN
jgi:hypothetical protein